VFPYTCINRNGDGADQKLPKTIVVASKMVGVYFRHCRWKSAKFWSCVGTQY